MNILLDTNILIHLAKDPTRKLLKQLINPDNSKVFVSIVSFAELKSIALQNNWGARKWDVINAILDEVIIVEINENLVNVYAEIDAYSQRRNPAYTSYLFNSSRNMGKNDLWIAATAALLGLKLITTDTDFNHLDKAFIEVKQIMPELFMV